MVQPPPRCSVSFFASRYLSGETVWLSSLWSLSVWHEWYAAYGFCILWSSRGLFNCPVYPHICILFFIWIFCCHMNLLTLCRWARSLRFLLFPSYHFNVLFSPMYLFLGLCCIDFIVVLASRGPDSARPCWFIVPEVTFPGRLIPSLLSLTILPGCSIPENFYLRACVSKILYYIHKLFSVLDSRFSSSNVRIDLFLFYVFLSQWHLSEWFH